MKDFDIVDYVKGKTIALVGPASYMQDSGFGQEIEKHDIVVRINRGIESTEQYPKDLGQRTDIYYSCLIERAQQTGILNVEDLLSRNIRCIVAPPHSDMKGIARERVFHSLVDREKVKKINEKIPVYIVDCDFHTVLAKVVDCKPNTGFLAIYDILRLKPEKLSIYGFSFYLDGFIKGQKSGVENEKNCSESEFATLAFNSKRHVQKNMWNYAKSTLLNTPNDATNGVEINLDPVLSQILNLPELSRELFAKSVKLS